MPDWDDLATEPWTAFSQPLQQAIRDAATPGLGEGPRQEDLAKLLRDESPAELLPGVPASRHGECLSGLWLLAGDLDRSHTLSQSIDNPEGSFWHGIMHRREGDYGNAKYWFRRVGDHQVFDQLRERAGDVYRGPAEFVDACAAARRGDDEARQACERVQWLEWQLLMAYGIGG